MQHHRWVEKEAAGVVAAIIAYNYPNQLALAKLAPALAAGCTVVLKGAPDTPLITLALGELIANHTDIPAGVVNVLVRCGPRSRRRADHQPRRRHGHLHRLDARPGGRSWPRPARRCKRVFLELGGKSAAIVLDDADFDIAALFTGVHAWSPTPGRAVRSRRGCWCRARTTTRSSRLVKNNFGRGALRRPRPIRGTYMGPLISEKQRDKVDGMVKRAVEAGATLVTGGEKVDPGLLLHADAAHRRRPRQRDRPGRGVRAGAGRHRLRRRRRRGAHRQQLDLRPVRRGVRQPRTARSRWRAASAPARSPSTAATTSAPTARSAATSSRASAGRWAPPGSRSSWSARRSRRWSVPMSAAAAGRHPRPRGRDVRVRPVGGRGARPSGAPTSSRSSTRSPATRSAGCARPARCASRATPTRTSSTPTAASAASGLDMSVPEGREVLLELARARRRVPDQLPARTPARSSASTSTTSAR